MQTNISLVPIWNYDFAFAKKMPTPTFFNTIVETLPVREFADRGLREPNG
jgi:hypothetical protein